MSVPFVKTKLSKDGKTVTIKCPYCSKIHTHGTADGKYDKEKGYGHRISHCTKDKNPDNNGYYLV